MATAKKSMPAPRRGPNKEEIVRQIVNGYRATEGCPPLSTQWGGYDLSKTAWLRKFAEEIVNESKTLEGWNAVKEKCNSSFIIELLYLLTLRGKVTVDESQDAYHALVAEIEKIVPRYDRLLKDVISLTKNPRFSSTMPYVRGSIEKISRHYRSPKSYSKDLRAQT